MSSVDMLQQQAPLTSAEAQQQAQANLTLLVADNKAGYFGVHLLSRPGLPKPYEVRVRRGGNQVTLGYFATAEEAALCVARSPEGQAAAVQRAAAAAPLTSEEARQQVQAEGLTLRVAENKTGYFGVSFDKPGQPKPYQARAQRDSKTVSLGSFATAEEAALCVARSQEGQAAAERAAVDVERAGGGADAARGREQGGLLRRDPRQARPAQALSGTGAAQRQGSEPGHLRHRRGGGAVHRTVAGGAGGTAAERAAAAAPLTSEEARQRARA
eukprot:scaffold53687_cov52-Phaeocystis_antarctica.AAC.1